MPRHRTPGPYVEETKAAPTIAPAATGVTAFVGHTLEGPINRVVPVKSFTEFAQTFGGLAASSEVSYAVLQFFRNGGERALIVRVPELDTGLPDLGMVSGSSSSVPIGLGCLEADDEFELLCVPDCTRPRQPGGTVSEFRVEQMAELWGLAIDLCRRKRAMLIVDAPVDVVSTVSMQAWIAALPREAGEFASPHAPWIAIDDPLHDGQKRLCAPGGSIAGLFVRTDRTAGLWKAPAGIEANIRNVRNMAANFGDSEQATVNALRALPDRGIVNWGARTLAVGGDFTYIPVRRTASFIERSLWQGTHWVVFEPNDEPLWARLRASVGAFLQSLFRRGAFAGQSPSDSYFVKCGRDTITQSDIDRGRVNVEIGFAPLQPAEFVIVRLALTTLPPSA